MHNVKPGPLLMVGGGVLMVIASFLKAVEAAVFDVVESVSVISFDAFGLLGLLILLFGAVLAAVGAISAFAPQVKLPTRILNFTLEQECFALAFTVFLWMFAYVGESGVKFGVHLAWIGAAIAAAGAVLSMRSTAAPASAPTGF